MLGHLVVRNMRRNSLKYDTSSMSLTEGKAWQTVDAVFVNDYASVPSVYQRRLAMHSSAIPGPRTRLEFFAARSRTRVGRSLPAGLQRPRSGGMLGLLRSCLGSLADARGLT